MLTMQPAPVWHEVEEHRHALQTTISSVSMFVLVDMDSPPLWFGIFASTLSGAAEANDC